MPLIVLPGQIPSTRIELQTRLGNDIANWRPAYLSQFMLNQIADLPARYDKMISRHKEPVPAYNCHGFTFASRRTWIDDPSELKQIMDDDRYIEINESEVLPGDVIIYYDEKNVPEHSGLVIREPAKSKLKVALICSKWGGFGEVVHEAHYGPYCKGASRFFRVL